jgi:cell division protein FtsB
VLQIARQIEQKRVQMQTAGYTARGRKLDDEINFLEREILNFVRNAAMAEVERGW